ncbi:fimbria/pilus outer membrane usher protein [Variovorax sp. EBFNA2]|uniref:fimbria/pilus outer membrane usher protein n=1 Tax=Variovorax sp. EBFNA2 TaxID=3342097 RepID=UPI0029C0B106|nr:fimbria/pilus outer membrane usher protein [Variovorax boronicumulans]WPG34976.1 fimbria/pilus outer membrane usher protein [Variovorax boronicumulans]
MNSHFQPRSSRQDFLLSPVCAMVLLALSAWQVGAHADTAATQVAQVEFETTFLAPGSSQGVDLSRFSKGNIVAPGKYSVDLLVNDGWIGRTDVTFKREHGAADGASAQPCLGKRELERAGVDLKKLPADVLERLADAGTCLPIGQIVPGASADFDFGDQRLKLSIPQVAMNRQARGYVSPEFWDKGVTAGFLDYSFNLYANHSRRLGQTQTQAYLGTRWGFNADVWRFRHDGALLWSSETGSRYQRISTFVQRDLPSLSAQLTIGETHTSGELFDSTAFRGVRLATDDRMVPESLRGYAPTVRGTARSNAKVTIKQSGSVVYDTTVAPGAFEINDLYATGYGGDLAVTVAEADGSEHTFLVPYAAVPMSLRVGANRFSVSAGVVRNNQLLGSPALVQATWQRGISNMLTAYGGVNLSQGYTALMLGGAFNTSFGAIGVDYTQSSTTLANLPRMGGGSARVSYSKDLPSTGGNIALAAYRYSTEGYMDLNTALRVRDVAERGQSIESVSRQRNRAQATYSQQLGDNWGQLQATVSATSYWNRPASDVGYTLGYNNRFKSVSYGVQVSRQRAADGKSSTMYSASLSIPLGKTNPVSVSANMSRDGAGRLAMQSTVSGSLGEASDLSYGASFTHGSGAGQERQTAASANLFYRTSVGDLSGTVGVGSSHTQASVGMRGGVVAHPGGITLAPSLSETFGIVEAPDAEGARLINAPGVKVNGSGYVVVPYLTPYSSNGVELDPKGMSTDVELQVTSQQVAPRAGAIVLLKYETKSGRTALFQVKQADGSALPFGATVLDEKQEPIGVVGQGSKFIARGLQDKGQLTVMAAEGGAAMCRISYEMPVREKGAKADGYERVEASCDLVNRAASTAR